MQLFRCKRILKSVEVANILREMVPEVRGEYDEIEKLVRLLIVCPASSAEAERSFSALRRLKTWLRSSMTQTRLNAVAVCHVHQNIVDTTIPLTLKHYAKCLYLAMTLDYLSLDNIK